MMSRCLLLAVLALSLAFAGCAEDDGGAPATNPAMGTPAGTSPAATTPAGTTPSTRS